MTGRTIWIGYDDREVISYAVARYSMRKWSNGIPIYGVSLEALLDLGWYTRKTETRLSEQGKEELFDVVSGAPMSTQFAISRFFILELAKRERVENTGWALFVDSDVMARSHLEELFREAEKHPDKALMCVPHDHNPVEDTKKDGALQAKRNDPRLPGTYTRKNWSSVMLFNRAHPANAALTLDLLNTVPGRDLHRFCWLKDEEIGFLDKKWNHLAGVEGAQSGNPAIVHFTNGGPWLPKYANVEYAGEWLELAKDWVR